MHATPCVPFGCVDVEDQCILFNCDKIYQYRLIKKPDLERAA